MKGVDVYPLKREPQFFGGIEGVSSREDPIVADESLEAGVVAVHPVDHVSAVACSESGCAFGIDLSLARRSDYLI